MIRCSSICYLHSVRFWAAVTMSTYTHYIMEVYIEKNNMPVELVRFRKKYRLYSRLRLRGERVPAPLYYVYSLFARWQQLATKKLITIHSPDGSTLAMRTGMNAF